MPIEDYLDMLAAPDLEETEDPVQNWSSDPPMTNGIFSSFLQ
jgi:hypothetical protein